MRGARGAIWRQRLWLWLPAALAVVLVTALLVGYRPLVAARVDAREGAIEERRSQLERLEAERRQLEGALTAAESTRENIEELYREHFGTRAERLTRMMARVKELAATAGLSGIETISYPEDRIEEFGLVRTSIVFGASGDYEELRRFINLLEVSDSFITLEQVRVTEAGGGALSFEMTLSTLFVRSRNQGTEGESRT